MKILAAHKFYYFFGGAERYFFALNGRLEQAGHTVVPFAMQHPKNFDSAYADYFVSNVNYWDKPTWRDKLKAGTRVIYSAEAQKQMKRLLAATKPELAHIHLISHQISPSILPIIKQAGLPIVQSLHDYKPICPTYSLVSKGKPCERCQGKHFYHATLQRCNHDSLAASMVNSVEMYLHHALNWYDLPDLYIVASNFMRDKLIEHGMDSSKLVTIPNFVDPEKFTYTDQEDDYFVYLGRLAPIKGVKTLLRAMSHVRSPHARLLIIGDGPQRAELEALKRDLNLANVEFCGFQTADKLRSLVMNAQFNILPSEVYDICPMSILEMMSMGKPNIGAHIGGIPELVTHGENGFLFESGNAEALATQIDAMLTSKQQRTEMGKNGRAKILVRYNPDIHYQQIWEAYQRVL